MTSLPERLEALNDKWDQLIVDLRNADRLRQVALRAFQEAYARAYIGAHYTPSNDSMRKQTAILATLTQAETLEQWDSEVRFVRDELRSLSAKTDLARSLISFSKAATA